MYLGSSGNADGRESEELVGKNTEQDLAVDQDAPEEFMLDGGAGDGALSLEGEKGEDLAAVTSTKKKDSLLQKLSVSAALVLLLAVTGWMAYTKVLAPVEKPVLPILTGLDGEIELYSKKLLEVRDALDLAWTAASDNVKKSFVANYMPSSERSLVPPKNALSYYKLHVLAMSEIDAPDRSEEVYVKRQHLQRQALVFCIVDAAVRRLEGLRRMEEESKLPALILGREKGDAKPPEGKAAVGLFLEKLKERNISYSPKVGLGKGEVGVSWAKVNELLDLMQMEDKLVSLDKDAHAAFEPFVESQRMSLKTMQPNDIKRVDEMILPRDGTPLDARRFLGFLHAKHHAHDLEDYRNDLLDDLVKGWSEQKVVQATELFKENHRKMLQDRIKQRQLTVANARAKALPLTHGFPLAVFLV